MNKIILLFILFFVIIVLYNYTSSKLTNSSNVHVYLINLPKNTERKDNFEKYYKGKYQIIEAVDGKSLVDSPLFKNWSCIKNKDYKFGTKALQLSNLKCFEDAKKNNYEWILIFEDDAEPPVDIDKRIQEIIYKYSDSKVIYLDNRNEEGEGLIPMCCTSALLYNNSTFDLLLKELNPETSDIMKNYYNENKYLPHEDCNFDFLLADILHKYNIKTYSVALVQSGRFTTTIAMEYKEGD